MVSKIFLDANVCLELLLRRENYADAKNVFEKIFSGDCKAFITPAIVHIISYVLSKYHNNQTVKSIILDLLKNVKVIDCNHETALNAVSSQLTDIEDALQYYTAIHHKVDYFISLDKQLIKSALPLLPIYSPQDFLKEFDF